MRHDHAHHDHSHGHSHGHGHGHHHVPADFGRAFAIGTALNLGFVVVEAAMGIGAGSMALVADAGHNLADVAGLVVAWGGAVLARRAPAGRFTYGLRGSSILAALLNALLLLVTTALIAIEAVRRLIHPEPAPGGLMMAVAAVGILVNGGTALLFASGRKGDLNVRGAFVHMAVDALVSAGVVVAGALIALTGARWIDPAASLAIVVVIGVGGWGLLRDAVAMSLQAAPAGADPAAVAAALAELPGVTAVHDLHVWPMSTTEVALTAHLVMPGGFPGDGLYADATRLLHARFGIDHATLQIETGPAHDCALAAPGTV